MPADVLSSSTPPTSTPPTVCHRLDLGGAGWTVRPVAAAEQLAAMPGDVARPATVPGEIPATVPGAVQLDLMAAGVLADPLVGLNEREAQWVGRLDWEFTRRFEVVDGPVGRRWLVLDGLDTVATVMINDEIVHRSRNMHRSWRVDVTDVVVPGTNTLRIRIDSALVAAERRDAELGVWPNDYPHPYNQIRKQASSFGWDWGPTLVGAGSWRPITLETVPTAAIAGLVVRTEVPDAPASDATHAPAGVHVEVAIARGDHPASLELVVRGPHGERVVPVTGDVAIVAVDVPDAELWFPVGYGPAPLHVVAVELRADGVVLDRAERRVGFRHIAVDTRPDRHGRAFTLLINGRPVFVKGFNWIPDDPFPTRTGAAAYATRLDQALAANANLVRVWGGGLFEDDAFYDHCDERGLLVWQDFLLACAGYPEDDALAGEIAAEATEAVRRLNRHPSVVIWNGGNENLQGFADWGWPGQLQGRPWGETYARETFPAVVAAEHPGTPYLVNSPHSSTDGVHPNLPGEGTTHQWDTWNRLDHRHYRDTVPRFAAEYGWQAPPTLPTLHRAVGPDGSAGLRWDSETFLAHQKQTGGGRRLVDRLAPMVADVDALLDPDRFADFHLATSLNQAAALRTAIEHLRSWWPRSAGSVVWQLNDCWPVSSWAVIDGDGIPKLGWYAARACYADRIVTVQPRQDGLVVAVVNDTDEPWQTSAHAALRSLDGTVRREHTFDAVVGPRSVHTELLPPLLGAPEQPRAELLIAEADGLPGGAAARSVWRFVDQAAVRLDAGRFTARLGSGDDDTQAVVVVAEDAVLDLVVLAELVAPGAVVDSALVTLFPGEEHTFVVSGLTGTDPAGRQRLTDAQVLRCANQLTLRR